MWDLFVKTISGDSDFQCWNAGMSLDYVGFQDAVTSRRIEKHRETIRNEYIKKYNTMQNFFRNRTQFIESTGKVKFKPHIVLNIKKHRTEHILLGLGHLI
jgi:hypothetical protein